MTQATARVFRNTPLTPPDRHFRTDHLSTDLKGRSVRGGAVTVLAQAIKFLLNIGSTSVLARLLTPADFGLVAMVTAFTGFAGLFKDIGLSMATVQQTDINHEQVSTLFWMNVLIGVLVAGVCAASAPLLALLYGEHRLLLITLSVSVPFLFAGLTAQHGALLQRQMRFAAMAIIEIIGLVAGIVAGITLALVGAQYWALVGMMATHSFVAMVGVWTASRWRPGLPRWDGRIATMVKFGGNLTGFNVLAYLAQNFDSLLIGEFLGAAPLGVYSKAYNLLMMPIRQITSPMGAVARPALCRLQHEPERYRRFFLKALELVSFGSMPLVAWVFVSSDDLIRIVLGPQWDGAVPVFKCLAPAAFMGSVAVVPDWLCNSLGNPHRLFRWALVSVPIIVFSFCMGLQWGTTGVAAAFSVTWCTTLTALIVYSCIGTPIRFIDVALRLCRPALASLTAAALTAGVLTGFADSRSTLLRVACSLLIFWSAFLGLYCWNAHGRQLLRNLLNITSYLRLKQ